MRDPNGVIAGLASITASTTIFSIAFSLTIREFAALGVWPGVFIIATLQHFIVVAPAYLMITRLRGPVNRSPLWSFALWGAGLATAPWLLMAMTDSPTYWSFHAKLMALTCISGIVGGLVFGKLMRRSTSTPAAD